MYLATNIFSHVSTSDPLTWSSRSQIQAKRAGGEQKLCCACLFSTNCLPVYNVAYTTSHTMSQYNSVLTVPGRGYHGEQLSKCHKKTRSALLVCLFWTLTLDFLIKNFSLVSSFPFQTILDYKIRSFWKKNLMFALIFKQIQSQYICSADRQNTTFRKLHKKQHLKWCR